MTFTDELRIDESGEGTEVEIKEKRAVRGFANWATVRRQVERAEIKEWNRRMLDGHESYVIAIQDPASRRWKAGVMLCTAYRKFKRHVSLAVFATAEEAMDAATRWKTRLENR